LFPIVARQIVRATMRPECVQANPDKRIPLRPHPTPEFPRKRNKERAKEGKAMKNILWLIGGFCAAAVGLMVWGPKRTQPVQLLAHRLEEAWADHHTVA
jgi:hypothetical protein